jgi:hypothetical protein
MEWECFVASLPEALAGKRRGSAANGPEKRVGKRRGFVDYFGPRRLTPPFSLGKTDRFGLARPRAIAINDPDRNGKG